MNSIVITGGTGYLGRNLIQALSNSYKLTALIRPKSNISLLPQSVELVEIGSAGWLEKIKKVDAIFHCATNYGRGVGENVFTGNVEFPLKMLRAISDKAVVLFNIDTSLPKEVSDYSYSKWQFRQLSKEYPVKVVHIQSEYFYGPGDGQWKFITWCIREMMAGRDIKLSACQQKRDFIYIDDAILGLRIILENCGSLKSQQTVQLGSGIAYCLKDVVRKIADLLRFPEDKIHFGALPYRKNEVMLSCADTTTLRGLKWSPSTDLEKGLAKTVDFEKLTDE